MIEPGLVKFLPDGEKERMRNLEQLFDSKGWKILEEWINAQYVQSRDNTLLAKTWADNRMAFGRLTVFGDLRELPERTTLEFEEQARAYEQAHVEAEVDDELEYE